MKDFAVGTIPGAHGSPAGSRVGPSESVGDLRGAAKGFDKYSKFIDFAFSRGEARIRLTLNLSGGRTFRETTREGAPILEGTVQDWAFPHENVEKSCGFVVNSGITKGVLFGFR